MDPSSFFSDAQRLNAATGHLKTQFEAAKPVLFTGAGFSLAAKNILGTSIPTVKTIRESLWKLCFGEEPFEESNSLQDLFQLARTQRRNDLIAYFQKNLSVEAHDLPDWYKEIFSLPWHRIYTLNIDNLAEAANRAFKLPRPLKPTSATAHPNFTTLDERANLRVVHLNGTLDDVPDAVTFSFAQYAERLTREEPWYNQLISDLLSRPVVFVGTQLDEPPLWQYIEKRRSRGGRSQKELRPKSYLVTPSISKARQSCLIDYNITHLPMLGHEFVESVLNQVKAEAALGHQFLLDLSKEEKSGGIIIPEVASLATHPTEKTSFLFGAEPAWSDIQSGRAFERAIDLDITRELRTMLARSGLKGCLVITGTAGTGKGTSLKRIALKLSSEGHRVAWVDPEVEASPFLIRRTMSSAHSPGILAIDEADMYGNELSALVREICSSDTHPIVILGVRSGRLDRVLNPAQTEKIPISEKVMPGLTDGEIDSLIDVLTRENRLGVLRNEPFEKQRQVFREKCGRQLLVAMIEATSGEPFEQKIRGEYSELETEAKALYALISVASSFRFFLTKQDLLLAVGDASNDVLNALEKLVQRNIVMCEDSTRYHARHRVIADVVFSDLTVTGQVAEVLTSLTRAAALQMAPSDPYNSRHHRLVKRLTNHELLKTAVGWDEARHLYGNLEALLSFEHNYWLQRGSLEVEVGNLHAAENFLNQARQINPSDMNVQTEYAYLLFRKAILSPAGAHAMQYVEDARQLLSANIANRGSKDAHSYHVYGSNLLEWVDCGIAARSEQKAEIEQLMKIIEEGCTKHPTNDHLRILREKVKHAYLLLAVQK